MCSKPKIPAAAPAPTPAPTPVSADVGLGNSEADVAERQRRKRGFTSTQVARDRTILGAVEQATDSFRRTLG